MCLGTGIMSVWHFWGQNDAVILV